MIEVVYLLGSMSGEVGSLRSAPKLIPSPTSCCPIPMPTAVRPYLC